MKKIFLYSAALVFITLFSLPVYSADKTLEKLISEALENSPELLMLKARIAQAEAKIPFVQSFMDPMVMVGYQNDGVKEYSYGMMEGSMWMFGLSQSFMFPGKPSLKGRMAEQDALAVIEMYKTNELKITSRIKDLYYEIFLAEKTLKLIDTRINLFSRIEEAFLSRAKSGMGSQGEVLMAQTEKLMLAEKKEMLKQKKKAAIIMLAAVLGRVDDFNLTVEEAPEQTIFNKKEDELYQEALLKSPEIKYREKMNKGAEYNLTMANREYLPDFTLALNYYKKKRPYEDMLSGSISFNLPVFFASKQNNGVKQAEGFLNENKQELAAYKVMLKAQIREYYSMLKTSEILMELYQKNLIPKTVQDFELALNSYISGKAEISTVINKLKNSLEYEVYYWTAYIDREKAVSKLDLLKGEK